MSKKGHHANRLTERMEAVPRDISERATFLCQEWGSTGHTVKGSQLTFENRLVGKTNEGGNGSK
jgi:hypothetical protein